MNREDTFELRNTLTVLETVSKNAECKSFGLGYSLLAVASVRQHAGQIHNLADPAAVIFTFYLNPEIAHGTMIVQPFSPHVNPVR